MHRAPELQLHPTGLLAKDPAARIAVRAIVQVFDPMRRDVERGRGARRHARTQGHVLKALPVRPCDAAQGADARQRRRHVNQLAGIGEVRFVNRDRLRREQR